MKALIETNRRRFLLGLAAASTAAATATAADAPIAENPRLIELAADLPSIAETYHAAVRAYNDMQRRWNEATPLAPDDMTVVGTGSPLTTKQEGETETYVLGGYLYRKGEEFPRRILAAAWKIQQQISEARRRKRLAKKNGSVVDFLDAEENIAALKGKFAKVSAYYAAYRDAKSAAMEDHQRLSLVREVALKAFADQMSAIMDEDDWTMEGLVIKAEALVQWSRVEKTDRLIATIRGSEWHAGIASAILRHAERGVA